MKCGVCGHEWVAVSPLAARELQCPSCGEMTAVLASREEAIRDFNRAILASPLRDGEFESGEN